MIILRNCSFKLTETKSYQKSPYLFLILNEFFSFFCLSEDKLLVTQLLSALRKNEVQVFVQLLKPFDI